MNYKNIFFVVLVLIELYAIWTAYIALLWGIEQLVEVTMADAATLSIIIGLLCLGGIQIMNYFKKND